MEALTYRMEAHTNSDDPSRYRTQEEFDEAAKTDPIARMRNFLQQGDLYDEDLQRSIDEQAQETASYVRAGIYDAPTATRWNCSRGCGPSGTCAPGWPWPTPPLRRASWSPTEWPACRTRALDHAHTPPVTYCHPDVASVGLTEAQARDLYSDVNVTTTSSLRHNAKSTEGIEQMRVTVFGAGGVGGYLAARLATAPEVALSVVARGNHLKAIQDEGLRLESPNGDLHVHPEATDDPRDIGQVDVVFLTVKGTDVPVASQRMGPLVGPDTTIVTFQNGIDSPRQVSEVLPGTAILPGLTYIFSTIAAPGVVRHTAGPARYVFGEPKEAPTGRAVGIGQLLSAAGVNAEVVDDVDLAMWSKFIIICSTAGVTAPSRLPIHVLREDPATWSLFVALVQEAAGVGRAAGVALGDDAIESALAFIAGIGPGAYSSLLYDLVNGKPMELETLHGTIVRLADEFGVDVPSTRTVYALLSPWARRNAAPANDAGTHAVDSPTFPDQSW